MSENLWQVSEHHLRPAYSGSTMPRYALPGGGYCTSQTEASLAWARHYGLIKGKDGTE